MGEKPSDLGAFGSFQNRLRSVSSPDLLELAAASDALPHSSGTDAAPPADAAASPDPKTIRSRALQRLSVTSQQQQQQPQHPRRPSAGPAIPNGVPDRGPGNIEAVSMQSDVTDVSVSGGSGTACHNDLGWLDEDLVALAERMNRELEVRDRHWRLKRYRGCFVGREAVRWMVNTAAVAPSEDDAVALGNAMLHLGLIAHVTYEHNFENRTLFYRFHLDSISSIRDGAAPSNSWGLRGVETGEGYSLAGEVSRLQRRVRDLSRELELQQGVDALLHEGSAALERRQRVIARRLLKLERAQRRDASGALPAASARQPSSALPVARWQRVQTTLAVLQAASVALVVVLLLRASESVGVKAAALMLLLLAAVSGMLLTQHFAQLAAASQRDPQTDPTAAQPSAQQTRQGPGPGFREQTAAGQPFSAPGGPGTAAPAVAAPSAGHRLSSVASARHALEQHGTLGQEDESGSDWSDFGSEASFQSSEQHHGSEQTQEQASPSMPELEHGAPEAALPARQPAPNAPTPPPGPADIADTRDAPCLLRLKPVPGQRVALPADPSHIALNTGEPIDFESDMFAGRVMMWVKGLPSAAPDLFKGKRRRTRITVQGRFKRAVSFDEVITGQEFSRVKDLPAKWLVETVLIKMAKAISPSVEIGPLTAPSVLVPVVAMAQSITVSEPGQEPDMAAEEAEDMRLCGPQMQDRNGQPLPAGRRRNFFMKPENRRALSFQPGKVYTFHIFQHLVDCSTYELDLSVYRFDLTRYLDGQPLQFMMRTRAGDPIFAFELWHERLLPAAAIAARAIQR